MKEEIFNSLTPEARKQLASLGTMLQRPVSEEEQEIQATLDAYVDWKEKQRSRGEDK